MNKRYIKRIVFGIIYILLILFFTYKCFETGDDSSSSSYKVAKFIKNVLGHVGIDIKMTDGYITLIRKLIGHFTYFLILGIISIIFYLTFNPYKIMIAIHYCVGFIFAFASEFLFEGNTVGRNASFKDVIIDFSGFILGSSVIVIFYLIHKKKK